MRGWDQLLDGYLAEYAARGVCDGSVSLATSDLPAAVTSASHNANNQLTSWAGATLTYDLNGNLTGDGTSTYTWNARDQLASLSGGSSASFVYDGMGRRRSKTIGSTQTGFLYDGMNFVQELTGSTVNANLITGGIDEVFLRKEGSTPRHFMSDALGSVIALTDAAGAVQTQYSYEPYGKTTVSGTANANSQRYTSREEDGTGLLYYRARYYSPALGRFVSEDPMGAVGGINLYRYAGSDPINFRDPDGKFPGPVGAGISAAVNFGLQFSALYSANGGDIVGALKCVNVSSVVAAGIVGFFFPGAGTVMGSGFRWAAGRGTFTSFASNVGLFGAYGAPIKASINSITPDYSVGGLLGSPCQCPDAGLTDILHRFSY